jgi:hypothetical protein
MGIGGDEEGEGDGDGPTRMGREMRIGRERR